MSAFENLIGELKNLRQNKRIGHVIVALPQCTSTNDVALDMAKRGAADGTLVIAQNQTQGKGRQGRTWLSHEGMLAFSIVLRPSMRIDLAPRLTMLTAVALLEAMHQFGINAQIKWPNDVLIPTANPGESYANFGPFKKACGILVETSSTPPNIDAAVVGIGINVRRPPEAQKLAHEVPHVGYLSDDNPEIDNLGLLTVVLEKLDYHLENPRDNTRFANCITKLRKNSATLGKKIQINDAGKIISGEAIAINADGSLQIKDEHQNIVTHYAGDVWLI
jgi:BirA family biotin operon repressor/biotin-[acetyl-CoA-carboxylase] ligase